MDHSIAAVAAVMRCCCCCCVRLPPRDKTNSSYLISFSFFLSSSSSSSHSPVEDIRAAPRRKREKDKIDSSSHCYTYAVESSRVELCRTKQYSIRVSLFKHTAGGGRWKEEEEQEEVEETKIMNVVSPSLTNQLMAGAYVAGCYCRRCCMLWCRDRAIPCSTMGNYIRPDVG